MDTYDYHVERTGRGKPILFLPAAGFSGNEGLNIAEHLSSGFETHMIDLPGFGRSGGIEGTADSMKMAEWVKGYLDREGIEKAFLIGHSMGGALLLAFAFHFPERVNKLVLLDQGHKRFPRIPAAEFGTFAYALPLLNVGVKVFGRRFLKMLEPLFSGGDGSDERDMEAETEQFCRRFSIPDTPHVRLALKSQVDFSIDALNLMFGYYNLNLPKLLQQVKVPVHLVYATFEGIDEKEAVATRKAIMYMERRTDLVAYHSLDGGHYVHWNEEFDLGGIRRFIESSQK
ncbi:hydrolase [Bacillus sp. MKU004]|nr:hydrolase [Bacillus sp. MKU004]